MLDHIMGVFDIKGGGGGGGGGNIRGRGSEVRVEVRGHPPNPAIVAISDSKDYLRVWGLGCRGV